MTFYVTSLDVVRPISWLAHADYKYTKITITVLHIPESTDAQPPFAEWVVQPWWKGKYPSATLDWVLAVPNLIHTYIHCELLCLTPILVSEDFKWSSVATVCPPWERHCFKDGSYNHYRSSTMVAPWPTVIAPKFKALGKAREFLPGKPKVAPCSCTHPRRMEG